jgi:hypoxanthine phosphoribosyltransferase
MDNGGQAIGSIEPSNAQDTAFKVSWQDFAEIMDQLVRRVPRYNTYVGIALGGLFPAAFLAKFYDAEFMFMQFKHYKDRQKLENVRWGGNYGRPYGSVLIVDDVSDTGETLIMAQKQMPWADTLTLFVKPQTKFKPTYFWSETDRWIEYPWERSIEKRP